MMYMDEYGDHVPQNPLIIRAPLFLIFTVNKKTPEHEGEKGSPGT